MTSHNNFNTRFSKRSWDVVRDLLFEFDLIYVVWLPGVLIYLEIGHCKIRNVGFAGQQRNDDVIKQLQSKNL